MNVQFKIGEVVNGFVVKGINGVSEYVFENHGLGIRVQL